ncbi:ankyrin repeat-containing domain protein, partial [Achaetomium macrosporum]
MASCADPKSQYLPGKTKNGGGTLPDVAAEPGLQRMLAKLIARGANVDALDNNGMTPLHYAALAKDLRTLQDLIALGADVSAADNAGKTVLHHLADSG